MNVILRQSLANTLLTYIGFALGGLNYTVLYLRFMSDAYFGLVGVLLSTAALLTPLMSFGIPNALVKFYSDREDQRYRNQLLTFSLILPLLISLPLAGISSIANEAIGAFMARRNPIVRDYVWHIFLIGLGSAYFEVFFAWGKVKLKSVFGTFLKEVFIRLGVTILLFLLHFGFLNEASFLIALVLFYLIRTLLMLFYGYKLQPISLDLKLPEGWRNMLKYSLLIIIGGSVSVLLLEVDRFMINQYVSIENVAYYSLAIFIATVIIVPWRAMHQITYPLTAKLMSANDQIALKTLYQKSSLNLFLVSGYIFLLLVLNLTAIYQLVPESYREGALVVVIIGGVKIYDSFLGINTSILYNSKFYLNLLGTGVALAVLTVVFNSYFIPRFGIIGAAYATALAVFLYNTYKLLFVWIKLGLHPFSIKVFWVLALGVGVGVLCNLLPNDLHPLWVICLRGIFITLIFGGCLWFLKLSEEFNQLMTKILERLRPRKL
ncbi:MAG: hypothetical protein RLZZ241_218 [Bacteroidota bacterium]|jgi:O-antigen/teichoic acid export membrane protein